MLHHIVGLATQLATSNLQPAGNLSVTVYPTGTEVVSGTASSPITVRAGHSLVDTDDFLIVRGTTIVAMRTVNGVPTATSLPYSDPVTVEAGDFIINLGADTSSTADIPNWDGSPINIYNEPSGGSTALADSTTTTDITTGEWDLYYEGDGAAWIVVHNGAALVREVIAGENGLERLNAIDFGLLGDDSTNNAARCNTWFRCGENTGKVCWLGNGTFRIGSQVTVNANLRIGGNGLGKFSRSWSAASGGSSSMFYSGASAVANVEMRDFRLTNSHATNINGDYIWLWSTAGVVEDIFVERFSGSSTGGRAFILAGDGLRVSHLTIINPAAGAPGGSSAIRFVGGDKISFSDSHVDSDDDCVQFTAIVSGGIWENLNVTNAQISNITGSSNIARLINIGINTGSATYSDISITSIHGDASNELVRVRCAVGATGSIKRVYIDGVSGTHDTDGAGERLVHIVDEGDNDIITDVHVRNVQAVGTSTSLGAVTKGLVEFTGVDDCSFTDSTIDGSAMGAVAGAVVLIETCARIEVSRNRISGNANMDIIELGVGSTQAATNCILKDNILTNLASDKIGIDCMEGTGHTIQGNTVLAASSGTGTAYSEKVGAGGNFVEGNNFGDCAVMWDGAGSALASLFINNHMGLQSHVTGITAGTTQTQAGATALTAEFNVINVNANEGNGVALPKALAGRVVTIKNNDVGQGVQVWPQDGSGDIIDRSGANGVDPYVLPPISTRTYRCHVATQWYGDGPLQVNQATYSVTNDNTNRTFDADTVVIANLADVVATIIADMQKIGLVK